MSNDHELLKKQAIEDYKSIFSETKDSTSAAFLTLAFAVKQLASVYANGPHPVHIMSDPEELTGQ